jgi:hypothetical protein
MKFINYRSFYLNLTIILLVINISFSLTLMNKISSSSSTEVKTDTSVKNKLTTSNKNNSKLEMTFFSSNSNASPETAKIMENIFTSRPIKVEARLTIDGVENNFPNKFNQNENINFGTPISSTNLRFKQNDNNNSYQLKNLEIPEIVHPKKSIEQEFKLPQGWNYNPDLKIEYIQNFYEPQKLQNIENDLLLEFKDFLISRIRGKDDPQRLEVLSFKNITVTRN